MSLEKRVQILEARHANLDESVHSLAQAAAEIKDIARNSQQGIDSLKDDATTLKVQMVVVSSDIAALNARFDKQEEQINQLELLIRQHFTLS